MQEDGSLRKAEERREEKSRAAPYEHPHRLSPLPAAPDLAHVTDRIYPASLRRLNSQTRARKTNVRYPSFS